MLHVYVHVHIEKKKNTGICECVQYISVCLSHHRIDYRVTYVHSIIYGPISIVGTNEREGEREREKERGRGGERERERERERGREGGETDFSHSPHSFS